MIWELVFTFSDVVQLPAMQLSTGKENQIIMEADTATGKPSTSRYEITNDIINMHAHCSSLTGGKLHLVAPNIAPRFVNPEIPCYIH